MTKQKNYGKSVRTKLLNLMNKTGYKYMHLLARYFNERLLYRVSVSPYKDSCWHGWEWRRDETNDWRTGNAHDFGSETAGCERKTRP